MNIKELGQLIGEYISTLDSVKHEEQYATDRAYAQHRP